jgi:hypothetical protein
MHAGSESSSASCHLSGRASLRTRNPVSASSVINTESHAGENCFTRLSSSAGGLTNQVQNDLTDLGNVQEVPSFRRLSESPSRPSARCSTFPKPRCTPRLFNLQILERSSRMPPICGVRNPLKICSFRPHKHWFPHLECLTLEKCSFPIRLDREFWSTGEIAIIFSESPGSAPGRWASRRAPEPGPCPRPTTGRSRS